MKSNYSDCKSIDNGVVCLKIFFINNKCETNLNEEIVDNKFVVIEDVSCSVEFDKSFNVLVSALYFSNTTVKARP